jgi:gamma-glutamyltranspeptidase / glutathione hydrolase
MLITLYAAYAVASESATTNRGVVVCDEPLAAEVGARILKQGGNAVDAAVAVAFALAVVEPTAGNIGGGGFMLVRMANGRSEFLDYREQASRHATRDMYLGPDGNVRPDASTLGPLASGVPGTVAGMGEASRRFGRLPWKDLLEPAYNLAHAGFPISRSQVNAIRSSRSRLSKFGETAHQYVRDNNPYAFGETVQLPDLAETLRRIRDAGASEFYHGKTASLIDEHMRRHGGIIDMQDLAEYRVRIRRPLLGSYRGRQLVTAPPPSSGGIALVEMLNILENGSTTDEVSRVHLQTEAMKWAFADRSEFLGDPDFVKIPGSKLVAKTYAKRIWQTIGERDVPSAEIKPGAWLDPETRQTTHFSVIDADGNAVANTYTLNGSFGAADSVDGAGFLLNNEMDDFAAKPGTANMFGLIQGERNAIGPRKRPLSSMTPTIVLKDGKVEMILGSPGGPTIINTVLDVFLYKSDLAMSPIDAVRAPRMHHQWMPDVLEAESLTPNVVDALKALGHRVTVGGRQGIANCIFVDPATGLRTGVADRRYPGASAVAEDTP